MSTKEEGLLKYWIALGIIGFAIGTALAGSVSAGGLLTLLLRDLGKTAAMGVLAGIFAYLPAGVIAGYPHFKWHKVESKMEV
jgi:hypothetical protein